MKKINFEKLESIVERIIRNNDELAQKTMGANTQARRFKEIFPYYGDNVRFYPYDDEICIARYINNNEDILKSKTVVDFKYGTTYIYTSFGDEFLEKYREYAICDIFAQILYLLLNKEGYGEYNGKMSEKCQFCGLLFLKRRFSDAVDIAPNKSINDVLDKILNLMCHNWVNKIIDSKIRDDLRDEFYNMDYSELLTFLYLNEGRSITHDLSSL